MKSRGKKLQFSITLNLKDFKVKLKHQKLSIKGSHKNKKSQNQSHSSITVTVNQSQLRNRVARFGTRRTARIDGGNDRKKLAEERGTGMGV